ncbi:MULTISPECIES: helix-turn-helix domain-containing protein [Rhizobium]|uniref:AraC-type DNA-binding protein n=1 Tax=Rhizobium lusitanum TaxID=293958 RepID=A0A1C3WCM1_9HYPH|nr:AraC family transcriptional regulator [Rhizobium lusitanum]SCB37464.1 AraC-type DNA-binding protein [Rhizobium lusitanum]
MTRTVSFIPFLVGPGGERVWGLGPQDTAIDLRPESRVRLADMADGPRRNCHKTVAGLSDWQKNKVVRYIDENIDGCIRVQELGDQVRLSASRFSKGFKVSFGRSPYDYVLSRRVDAAKYLISSTDEPLSQIAHACGLSDQAHLSKVFKRLVGVTPLKWRRLSAAKCTTQHTPASWRRLGSADLHAFANA